jgi:hypothetical protein
MIMRQVQMPSMTQQKECRRCGYTWESRAEVPVQCPRCKSPKWNETASQSVAHNLVARAIRKGELAPLDGTITCVDCGEPATVYDHRDYAYPLSVEPVCQRCNIKRGKGENRIVDSRLIRIKLTDEQYEAIRIDALKEHQTVAEYLAEAALERLAKQTGSKE